MMEYHVMFHTVSVAVVDANSGEEAARMVEANRALLKLLSEEAVAHKVQEKDLN